MICDKCKQKNAIYHSTLIINGVSESINLCEDCARSEGKLAGRASAVFDEFFNSFNNAFSKDIFEGFFCPSCSTSFTSFKNNGYVGCENCFDVFITGSVCIEKRVVNGSESRLPVVTVDDIGF